MPNLTSIKANGTVLSDFNVDKRYYDLYIPYEQTTIPTITAESSYPYSISMITPKIAKIVVTGVNDPNTKSVYNVTIHNTPKIGLPDNAIKLTPASVTGSAYQKTSAYSTAIDNNVASGWSAAGEQSLVLDYGEAKKFNYASIVFSAGNARSYRFTVETSNDNVNWTMVYTGKSNGSTAVGTNNYETVPLGEAMGRFVRISGSGNSVNAWKNLNEVAFFEIVVKSLLANAITKANDTIATEPKEGLQDGQTKAGATDILKAAIILAQSVYDSKSISQADVDSAVVALNTAVETFKASRIGIYRTALATGLTEANGIYGTEVEGISAGQYPIGSKQVLADAISVAQTVYETKPIQFDPNAVTQAQVDAAVVKLTKAQNDFQTRIASIFTGTVNAKLAKDKIYNLGTKFYTDVDGKIRTVKIYTDKDEAGIHTVRIYSLAGVNAGAAPLAIYSDVNGNVGSLMGQTAEISKPSKDGWYSPEF